jgi:hypothetical protein
VPHLHVGRVGLVIGGAPDAGLAHDAPPPAPQARAPEPNAAAGARFGRCPRGPAPAARSGIVWSVKEDAVRLAVPRVRVVAQRRVDRDDPAQAAGTIGVERTASARRSGDASAPRWPRAATSPSPSPHWGLARARRAGQPGRTSGRPDPNPACP